MRIDTRRTEKALFIGEESSYTDELFNRVKLKDFKLKLIRVRTTSELISVCCMQEPAIIMFDMIPSSINTYMMANDVQVIGSLPAIAFAEKESSAILRIAEDIGVDKLLCCTGSLRRDTRRLADALTIILQYPDIKDYPEVRGHLVTEEDWHDPIREITDYGAEISQLIEKLGVRKSLSGHKYLVAAITMQTASYDAPKPRYLYRIVADYYDTTPLAVEKSIRYAIESAWTRGDIYTQHRLFGYSTDETRGKPTNAEFIARLALEFMYR